jgi:hypothetical protein
MKRKLLAYAFALAALITLPVFVSCGDDDDSSDSELRHTSKKVDGHTFVDLGLPSGRLWATCNVGASSPAEYGDYFAWGETSAKSEYNWLTYKWCNGASYDDMTKYCTVAGFGYNGFTDNNSLLDAADDAATANWGGLCHTPTQTEFYELRDYCIWQWVSSYKGENVSGYYVISKQNGNYIFLPAAGYRLAGNVYNQGTYGCYWTANLRKGYSNYACDLFFHSGDADVSYYGYREYGFTVRPVL